MAPLWIVVRRLYSAAGAHCGTDVGAEMDPAHSLRHDAWSSINECIDAEMAQFMTTGRYEQNVACGLGGMQHPHKFQPAGNASATLAGARVPTAARCHDNQWQQRSITAIDFGNDVERGGAHPLHRCDQANFCAALRVLAQEG